MMNISNIRCVFVCAIVLNISRQCFVSTFSTADQILKQGYPLEIHELETEDHYMIGMERIPYSKNSANKTIGKPIILLHGLYGTSMFYALTNKSLSFILSDAGYDVWLLNFRLSGISKYIKDPRTGVVAPLRNISWDFSFDELGIYDTTAGIDYILNKTGHDKLHMGGFSFGATICLIALAERPEYNDKIDKLLLIVPTARMKNYDPRLMILKIFPYLFHRPLRGKGYIPKMKNPDNQWFGLQCKNNKYMKWFCIYVMDVLQGNFLSIDYYINVHEKKKRFRVKDPGWTRFKKFIDSRVLVECYHNLIVRTHIKNIVLVCSRNDYIQETIDILKVYPQPTSIKVMTHYYQLIHEDYFRKYDYGKIENFKHYHSYTPPDYDLSKVVAATYIYHSKYDVIAPQKDIKWLVNKLPNVKNVTMVKKFSHMGFATSPYLRPINMLIVKQLLENDNE